jgi:hypothetical protein
MNYILCKNCKKNSEENMSMYYNPKSMNQKASQYNINGDNDVILENFGDINIEDNIDTNFKKDFDENNNEELLIIDYPYTMREKIANTAKIKPIQFNTKESKFSCQENNDNKQEKYGCNKDYGLEKNNKNDHKEIIMETIPSDLALSWFMKKVNKVKKRKESIIQYDNDIEEESLTIEEDMINMKKTSNTDKNKELKQKIKTNHIISNDSQKSLKEEKNKKEEKSKLINNKSVYKKKKDSKLVPKKKISSKSGINYSNKKKINSKKLLKNIKISSNTGISTDLIYNKKKSLKTTSNFSYGRKKLIFKNKDNKAKDVQDKNVK